MEIHGPWLFKRQRTFLITRIRIRFWKILFKNLLSNNRDKILHLLNIKFSIFSSLLLYKVCHWVKFPYKEAPNLPKDALEHDILSLWSLQKIQLLDIVFEGPLYSFLNTFLSGFKRFLNDIKVMKNLVFPAFFNDSLFFGNQILGVLFDLNDHITLFIWTINLLWRFYWRCCPPLS